MKKNAAMFVAAWIILSVVSMILIFNLNLTTNLKMNQFVCLDSSIIIGVGAFLLFNKDKISILFGNYKREKEI